MKRSAIAKWLTFCIMGIVTGVGTYWSYSTNKALIIEARNKDSQRFSRLYRGQLESSSQMAMALATSLATCPELAKAIAAENREQILTISAETYRQLNEKFKMTVLALLKMDGHVLARAHNPTHFGDDASKRDMIAGTILRKEPQKGIEIGTSGAKIRSVSPVIVSDKYVGILEVGFEFDEFIKRLTELSKFDMSIYIEQKFVEKSDGRIVAKFKEMAATNSTLAKHLVTDVDYVQDTQISEMRLDGELYGLVTVPLLDFGAKNVGTVVAYRNFSSNEKQLTEAQYRGIVQFMLLLTLNAGICATIFSGFILRPLRALIKAIRTRPALEDEVWDDFIDRDDEIGDLARQWRGEA